MRIRDNYLVAAWHYSRRCARYVTRVRSGLSAIAGKIFGRSTGSTPS
jgi:hypothetical protein